MAKASRVSALNSLGAGDAFLAGLISAFVKDASAINALSRAVAVGTAAVGCVPGQLPTDRQIAALHRCVKAGKLAGIREVIAPPMP